MYFKTETDVAQSLIDDFFFSNFDCLRTFPWETFYVGENMGIRS